MGQSWHLGNGEAIAVDPQERWVLGNLRPMGKQHSPPRAFPSV
jgi:hypothetical protein